MWFGSKKGCINFKLGVALKIDKSNIINPDKLSLPKTVKFVFKTNSL